MRDVSDPSAQRFAALLAREPGACEAFVDAHYQGVYRFFRWLTYDRDVAEDLTQETFLGFWNSLDRLERPTEADLQAWLYGIARNRWRKRLRGCRKATLYLEAAEQRPDPAPGPEELALVSWEQEEVARAVAGVPPEYREALVLRVFQELSYAQIADMLGIREGLARWRVHRARLWLRQALQSGRYREKTGATV
ncbi:MAG: sigma-70 family RNA polymerase sigma factor [Armatimonadetes bacterium]|nr:sigma-70 family RNA polymerase sigma factor [Armatimonadota bacterium]